MVVLDNDTVKYVKNNAGLQVHIQKITSWMIREFDKAIKICKDFYPEKSKKPNEPNTIWIAPPGHKFFGASNNKKRSITS